MKLRRFLLPILACSASLPAAAQGTNQYWNIGSSGGDGIWGTGPGEKNWNLTAGAASGNTTWANTGSEIAVFQDTFGGTVTLFDSIHAAGISQNGSDYRLSAGDIVLANLGPTLPAIHVNTGTLTIQSTLAGATGFQKTGPGTLALESSNTNSGPLQIGAGTLLLNGSLANTTVTIDSGATLTNASGGLATTANLTNSGTLTMGAADTIGSLVLNGGTIEGTGILTTTTTTLNGGTVAGSLLGNTTSTGNVLVSGALGDGSLDVTGGTLTLTGALSNQTVNIAANSGIVSNSGSFAHNSTATNSGTLTINKRTSIQSYIQNDGGELNGPFALFANTATLNGGTISGNLSTVTVASTGSVLVSGQIYGRSIDVNAGILTLTGSATDSGTITIAAGARLIDANGGLDRAANLTNSGTFTVNSADTIASYVSNGGILDGTGILTATTATLGNGSSVRGQLAVSTLSSSGNVTVSGPITATSTTIHSGIFTLAGSPFQSQTVDVMPGGTLLRGKSSPPSILTLNNSGTVNPGDGIVLGTYISTGGLLTSAKGGITADTVRLNDGSSIAGAITGANLFTNGNIAVTGKIAGSYATLQSGNLTLSGEFTTSNVKIDAGVTLTNQSGGLSSTMTLRNDGTLVMNQPDTIRIYQSIGGLLAGSALLTVGSASLASATIASPLAASSIETSGNTTTFSANVSADRLAVRGTLVNTASLTLSDDILIYQNATFVARGNQAFNLLTTVGTGSATWQGDLTNMTTIAPGVPGPGALATGILAVTGDFTNAPTGTLNLDLGTGLKDLMTVGGKATFGGALVLNQLSPVAPFVPVQVVEAGTYAGTFATLTENLDGTAWFNPSNGTVTTLSSPAPGDTLWGGTSNQSSAWLSLYDDVVEPGTTNVLPNPAGGYSLTSGPANAGNPDLLNALTWSTTPGGLNAAVLDRLSPEVYIGFQDYAIEATRAHQRTAMEAPSLGFIRPAPNPAASGGKDALPSTPATDTWEYFAALDYFDAATDSSPNQADYGLSGLGVVTGVRSTVSDTLRIGGYVAINEGSLDGSLIDGDADGWSLGVFARKLIHARTHTLITGGMSYGKYQFDGTRDSLIATAGGWTPANSAFSGVDSDSLEFYLGASALAFSNERFRLIPAAMLRYASGGMNGFAETAGGPGSPVPLRVGKDSYQNAIAELSLRAEADLTDTLTAHGLLGFSVAIRDHDSALSATFTPGGRPFRASAAGLDGDAFFIGLGAEWFARENLGLGIHWRADFRADAETENQFGLSTSFRF